MERRVHPIPFRTRQLSSLSPMILHIIMWESRSPPRIFAQAPSSFRAPGLFALLGLKPKRPNCRRGRWPGSRTVALPASGGLDCRPAKAREPAWRPCRALLRSPPGAGEGRGLPNCTLAKRGQAEHDAQDAASDIRPCGGLGLHLGIH